ncbi:MAG TPA: NAD+ synthase [Patescibacteria group bacterium]|nr:NAD+ synthase [Patescibacteria group bacterium]
MELNYQKKTEEIISWLEQTVAATGLKKVVVAVSGGIDSATSLALCVKAFGKENVFAICLPYGKMSIKATEDAKLLISSLGIPKEQVFERDIYTVASKIIQQVDENMSDIRKGNIMARVRMIFLYDLAKQMNGLVVGTENKTEHFLGYFTRFGDEASDIEPIKSLYKTQVWEVAKYLKIPEEIISNAPSAGLWEGQTDEREFGFSYKDADRILFHYFDEELPREAIVALGFKKELIDTVLGWVEKNDFKHHLPKVFEEK